MKQLSDVDCYEKETAVFECQFNYDDAPTAWFKDDEASVVQNVLISAVSIILLLFQNFVTFVSTCLLIFNKFVLKFSMVI